MQMEKELLGIDAGGWDRAKVQRQRHVLSLKSARYDVDMNRGLRRAATRTNNVVNDER
jgi:hypothetical protein